MGILGRDYFLLHLKYLGKRRNIVSFMCEEKSEELKFFFVINHIVGGTPVKERRRRERERNEREEGEEVGKEV